MEQLFLNSVVMGLVLTSILYVLLFLGFYHVITCLFNVVCCILLLNLVMLCPYSDVRWDLCCVINAVF